MTSVFHCRNNKQKITHIKHCFEKDLLWKNNKYLMEQYLYFYSYTGQCMSVCVCVSFLFLGYYTCVEVIFTLRRQVGFYMMGVYAPTLLIVVLSWLSFWINPDASAARVPLGKIQDFIVYTTCTLFFFFVTMNDEERERQSDSISH